MVCYRVFRARGDVAAVLLGFLFLLAGFFAGKQTALNTDAMLRQQMLEQALSLSRTVDPLLVRELSFTAADTASHAFIRLNSQLRAFGETSPFRGIWTMACRNGKLFFGPESYLQGDPLGEGSPGKEYLNPPEQDFRVFETGIPYVDGPYTDEYGTFVSASAPVIDPATGEVTMVIGIDLEAKDWMALITSSSRETSKLFAIPAVLLFLAGIAFNLRRRFPERWGRTLRHTDVLLVAALGLSITSIVATSLFNSERNAAGSSFSGAAASHGDRVRRDFLRAGSSILGSLVRFYGNSTFVSDLEFQRFAGPLSGQNGIAGLAWIPVVQPERLAAFRELLLSDGSNMDVLSAHSSGSTPVLPVWRITDASAGILRQGLNTADNQLFSSAVAEAAATGLPSISGFYSLPNGHPGATLFLYAENPLAEEFCTSGFAAAELDIRRLLTPLEELGAHGNEQYHVRLFMLEQGSPPILVDCTDPVGDRTAFPRLSSGSAAYELRSVHPLFAFGKTFAIVVEPGADYRSGSTGWLLPVTAVTGALLTLLAAFLTGSLMQRRAALEDEVRNTADKLDESENRYKLITENMADVIAVVNAEFKTVYISPSALAITGLPPSELSSLGLESVISRESLAELIRKLSRDMEMLSTEAFSMEVDVRAGTGESRRAEAKVSLIAGGEGYIISLRDVTDRKQAEAQKEAMEVQVHQMQKMDAVGRLAGGIAHDFNNMLGVIMGHCELGLAEADLRESVRRNLEAIQSAGKRSADLVSHLLTFARKQIANPVLLDLNSEITGMVDMLKRLIGEDITLTWEPDGLPCKVRMDPVQLGQIIVNLVVNSRDAIQGSGRIEIEVERPNTESKTSPEGDYVSIAVTDNGCGMDIETEEHAFEPFYSTKEFGKGTGLGLSTVYGIVQQNKGWITLKTRPGEGTAIRIFLPLVRAAGLTPGSSASSAPMETGTETILLVEDEPSLLSLGTVMLESLGYQVIPAESPMAALTLFQGNHVDLLVSDMIMPGMNGLELHRKLEENGMSVKALFISGYTADAMSSRGISEQNAHFLQKPFQLRELARAVRSALG